MHKYLQVTQGEAKFLTHILLARWTKYFKCIRNTPTCRKILLAGKRSS